VLAPRSTPDEIRAALRTTDDVRLLAVTDENDTWAVGEDRIAKFPRGPEFAAKVPSEIALYPLVRERLGDLVPRLLGHEETDRATFLVLERAQGQQGQTMDGVAVEPGEGLATDLGEILTTLHSITADEAIEAGAMRRELWFERVELAPETIERVGEIVGHDRLQAFLDAPPPTPVVLETLCHTDIKGEHLFLNDTCTRVRRVIDWADAEICDPAKDYAAFTIWLGPTFTHAVVAASGEDDGTLAERAIFLARAGHLGYWDNVLAGTESAPLPLLEAQVRAAFSD
jgi:Phosphotransferase enzyme family